MSERSERWNDVLAGLISGLIIGTVSVALGNALDRWIISNSPQLTATLTLVPHAVRLWGLAVVLFVVVGGGVYWWRRARARQRATDALHEAKPAVAPIDRYAATAQKDRDSIAQTFVITSTVGHFVFQVEPALFEEHRIPREEAPSLAKTLQISDGQFELPYSVEAPFGNLDDGIEKVLFTPEKLIQEAYRLHASGLFVLIRINPQDVRDRNNYTVQRILAISYLIKTITSMMLLAQKLASSLLVANADELSVKISMGALVGRVLFNDQPSIFKFDPAKGCIEWDFRYRMTITKGTSEERARELAIDCILKALWLLNQSGITRDEIEECQRGFTAK